MRGMGRKGQELEKVKGQGRGQGMSRTWKKKGVKGR